MSAPAATHRAWCAVYQWPDRTPFLLGTAYMRRDAPLHEVEAELSSVFRRMWAGILPLGTPLPALQDLRPGSLVFVGDGAA